MNHNTLNLLSGALFGVALGFALTIFIMLCAGTLDQAELYRRAITKCEAELPRNINCEIAAIIKETENND